MDLILKVILLVVIISLDILGEHTCMSLQDLVGGSFGGTNPPWAFIRAGSPSVGFHGPDLGEIQKMNVSFGGKGRDLQGPHISLTIPAIFPWRLKRHLGGLDVTLGLGFWC
jgi:hypothetical protein